MDRVSTCQTSAPGALIQVNRYRDASSRPYARVFSGSCSVKRIRRSWIRLCRRWAATFRVVTSSAFSLSCRAPGPLGLKHFVDLSLDIHQLRRFLRVPYAISECIEHVQRLPAVAGFTRPQEFPGCSQYRDKPSEIIGARKIALPHLSRKLCWVPLWRQRLDEPADRRRSRCSPRSSVPVSAIRLADPLPSPTPPSDRRPDRCRVFSCGNAKQSRDTRFTNKIDVLDDEMERMRMQRLRLERRQRKRNKSNR